MDTINLKQGTQEWFKARKNKITGSNVGAILGCDPWRSPQDVMRAMVRDYHGVESEFTGNPATEWGNANEQRAISQLELLHMECPVMPTGLHTHPEHDWLAASPDGLIEDQTVLEVKCPFGLRNKEQPVFKSIYSELPHYYAQIQMEMACTSRTATVFYQWAPHGESVQHVIYDPCWFADNLPKLKAFYESYLIEREMPNAQVHLEPKHKLIDEPLVADLFQDFKKIRNEISVLEVLKKDTLAKIIERCGGNQAECLGMKLTQVERIGGVEYNKIPELKGVDLEQYRKASSKYWSLK